MKDRSDAKKAKSDIQLYADSYRKGAFHCSASFRAVRTRPKRVRAKYLYRALAGASRRRSCYGGGIRRVIAPIPSTRPAISPPRHGGHRLRLEPTGRELCEPGWPEVAPESVSITRIIQPICGRRSCRIKAKKKPPGGGWWRQRKTPPERGWGSVLIVLVGRDTLLLGNLLDRPIVAAAVVIYRDGKGTEFPDPPLCGIQLAFAFKRLAAPSTKFGFPLLPRQCWFADH